MFKLILEKIDFFFKLVDLSFKAFLFFKVNRKFRAKLLDKVFKGKVGNEGFVRKRNVGAGTFVMCLEPEGNCVFLIAATISSDHWFGHGGFSDRAGPLVFEGLDEDVLFAVHFGFVE